MLKKHWVNNKIISRVNVVQAQYQRYHRDGPNKATRRRGLPRVRATWSFRRQRHESHHRRRCRQERREEATRRRQEVSKTGAF